MGKVVVAPVGHNMDALFVGIKELSTDKVILVADEDMKNKAEEVKQKLETFQIPARIKMVKGNLWESMFEAMAQIKKLEKDVIVNVSTGDSGGSGCAACSAAFVNGLKAITVRKGEVNVLPFLKFNYYSSISDRKKEILKLIYSEKECCSSLQMLSELSGMSLPLVSYHINGNLKSEGLEDMGLVKTEEIKGKVSVSLTTMGRLLIKGYINS